MKELSTEASIAFIAFYSGLFHQNRRANLTVQQWQITRLMANNRDVFSDAFESTTVT
jgi:hypothetical protein